MPCADQQIRQWTTLKLLESNGKITLQKIASELTDPCHDRRLSHRNCPVVLGFGAQVEVLQPVTLRRVIENESWKLLEKHQKIKSTSIKSAVQKNKKLFKK